MATVDIVLKNTTSGKLFAHITGSDGDGLFILGSDGRSAYRPTSPSDTLQPLEKDSAISVGNPGESRTVTVPKIFGSRIWFCISEPLTFYLNPGPALVEPNAGNESDDNFSKDWGFCEFTFNDEQIYVNVSYVDFVSFPIALQLENQSGEVRKVHRNILVMRARFSAIIDSQIHAACQNTVELDWRAADAVESRIQLDLRLTNRHVDLVGEEFDAALRVAVKLTDSMLVARRISDVDMGLYAAPSYLARKGTPRVLEEVGAHDWVTLGARQRLPEPLGTTPPSRLVTDDMMFVRHAVQAGMGLGLLPTYLAQRDVVAGQLVA